MRKIFKIHYLAAMLCALSLTVAAGCKPPPKGTQGQKREVSQVVNMVDERIAESAEKIRESLELLAKLSEQDAVVKSRVVAQPQPTDPALLQPLPMIWTGPLEPAVKTIAKTIGWACEVSGVRPGQPVIVQIRSKDMPVQKVLESFGWQAGYRVAVLIDEGTRTLKIVYLPEHEG